MAAKPREDQSAAGSGEDQQLDPGLTGAGGGAIGAGQGGGSTATQQGALKIEVALKDGRKAVILYPADMAEDEATKVGNVLKAIVG